VGFTSLSKRMPAFMHEGELCVDGVIAACRSCNKPLKFHTNMLESEETIRKNMRLVDLRNNSMIGAYHTQRIDEAIDSVDARFDRLCLMRILNREGISHIDVDALSLSMMYLTATRDR